MQSWTTAVARGLRAAAATALGVGLAVAMEPPPNAAARQRPDVPAVIEAAHCRGQRIGPGGDAPAGGLEQRVTVSVPRTAIVVVDHRGRVVEAATNTGCRPRAGDDVYVQRPDGTMVPAVPGAFAGVAWTGDFTRGLGHVVGRGRASAAGPLGHGSGEVSREEASVGR